MVWFYGGGLFLLVAAVLAYNFIPTSIPGSDAHLEQQKVLAIAEAKRRQAESQIETQLSAVGTVAKVTFFPDPQLTILLKKHGAETQVIKSFDGKEQKIAEIGMMTLAATNALQTGKAEDAQIIVSQLHDLLKNPFIRFKLKQ